MLRNKPRAPSKKMDTRLFGLAGVLVVVALIGVAGWIFFSNPAQSPTSSDGSIRNCRDIDRTAYGIIPEVFESLPPTPKCFHSVVEAYHAHQLMDDFFFSEEYFLQPEFYPEFLGSGKNQWVDPNPTHWGIVGYGAFPLQREFVMHAGETKKIRLFVHAGFGVRAFQGMGIRVAYKYPDTPKALDVILEESALQGFVLGPTFPKIHPSWARPIDIELHVKENAPAQNLEMTFYSTRPQNPEALAAPIVGRYSNATDYLGDRPLASLVVQIR